MSIVPAFKMAESTFILNDNQVELLIELVRENPAIYDLEDKRHKDTKFIRNTWIKILGRFVAKYPLEGLNVEILKGKWKNRYDSYKRTKKKLKEESRSGAGAKAVTKPGYYDLMTFLEPVNRTSKTKSNMRSSQAEEVEEEEQEEDLDLDLDLSTDPLNTSEQSTPLDEVQLEPNLTQSTSEANQRQTTSDESSKKPTKRTEDTPTRTGNKKKKKPSEVDTALLDVAQLCRDQTAQLSRMSAACEAEEDDFFNMIGRKAKRLSQETQDWLQEETWSLWVQAKRRDESLRNPSRPGLFTHSYLSHFHSPPSQARPFPMSQSTQPQGNSFQTAQSQSNPFPSTQSQFQGSQSTQSQNNPFEYSRDNHFPSTQSQEFAESYSPFQYTQSNPFQASPLPSTQSPFTCAPSQPSPTAQSSTRPPSPVPFSPAPSSSGSSTIPPHATPPPPLSSQEPSGQETSQEGRNAFSFVKLLSNK